MLSSYNNRKRRNQNQRNRLRRKARHREKCEMYMKQRQTYYNDILFDAWANNAVGDNALNYKETKLNYVLLKERIMQDIKKQREIVDICKITGAEPYEFVEKTKHDIPAKTWYQYLFG